VKGVGGHPDPCESPAHPGTACRCILLTLDDDHAGPFSEHEPVAEKVERTRGAFRLVVAPG
jgi:hypothetical protein